VNERVDLDALLNHHELDCGDDLDSGPVSKNRSDYPEPDPQPSVQVDVLADIEDFSGWNRVLSDAEKSLRSHVLALMRREWLPVAAEHYRAGRFPADVFRKLGSLGAIGASLVGGNRDPLRKRATAAIMHAVEYGDGGLRCALTVQDCVIQALLRFGTDAQRAQWLGPLCRGEKVASFALTEPQAGSDVRAVTTRAARSGNTWTISGRKGWITNAPHADVILVWARTNERNDAIRGFLVEQPARGLEVEAITSAAAMRAAPVGRITLDQVRVPESALLPHAWGLIDINACLDYNRMTVVFGVTGAARFCLESAINYARSREQFGEPICRKQLVQGKLADMASSVAICELLSLQLAQRWEQEPLPRFAVSLAKRRACAEALDVARASRSILGAHGLDFENHVVRHLLNLEASSTYGGTDEIHSLVMGKALTRESAF
jgi:glutaryl-CoA dehydrogenase